MGVGLNFLHLSVTVGCTHCITLVAGGAGGGRRPRPNLEKARLVKG